MDVTSGATCAPLTSTVGVPWTPRSAADWVTQSGHGRVAPGADAVAEVRPGQPGRRAQLDQLVVGQAGPALGRLVLEQDAGVGEGNWPPSAAQAEAAAAREE